MNQWSESGFSQQEEFDVTDITLFSQRTVFVLLHHSELSYISRLTSIMKSWSILVFYLNISALYGQQELFQYYGRQTWEVSTQRPNPSASLPFSANLVFSEYCCYELVNSLPDHMEIRHPFIKQSIKFPGSFFPFLVYYDTFYCLKSHEL